MLDDQRDFLCKNGRINPKHHYPYLRTKQILNRETCAEIDHVVGPTARANRFIDELQRNGSPRALVCFLESLRRDGTQIFVLKKLNQALANMRNDLPLMGNFIFMSVYLFFFQSGWNLSSLVEFSVLVVIVFQRLLFNGVPCIVVILRVLLLPCLSDFTYICFVGLALEVGECHTLHPLFSTVTTDAFPHKTKYYGVCKLFHQQHFHKKIPFFQELVTKESS